MILVGLVGGFAAALAYPFGQKLVATMFYRGPSWSEIVITQAAMMIPAIAFCYDNFSSIRSECGSVSKHTDFLEQSVQNFAHMNKVCQDRCKSLAEEMATTVLNFTPKAPSAKKSDLADTDVLKVEPRSRTPTEKVEGVSKLLNDGK